MDKIRVIISAWRAVDFLDECIYSFWEVPAVSEILIGIDGCNPTCRFIERRHEQYNYIKFYWTPLNKGNYTIYNSLIPLAKNEHILIFGADDIALPAISEQFYELKDECDIMAHCFDVLGHETQHITKVEKLHPSGGVICFKKSLIDEIGGFMPWRCAGDTEFMQRTKRNGKTVGFKKEPMFLRRSHNNNISKSKDYGKNSEARNKCAEIIKQHSKDNIMKIKTKKTELTRMEL